MPPVPSSSISSIEERFKHNLLREEWQIKNWLNYAFIKTYTLTPHSECGFTIEVIGDVDLIGFVDVELLPVKFSRVSGDFLIARQNLISLIGCPEVVGGGFYCQENKLTSLDFCPSQVQGLFNCSNNQITSLKGIQNNINSYFSCRQNCLTSLEGGPISVRGNYTADYNQIDNLDYFPGFVLGQICLTDNPVEKIYKPLIQASRFTPLYNLHLELTRPIKEKEQLIKEIALLNSLNGLASSLINKI